jgi:hypothetical protein
MNNEQIKNEIIELKQKEELSKKERRRLKKLEKRIVRNRDTRFKGVASLLKRGALGIVVVIVIWGVWTVFKQSQVPTGQIISRNGLHWHPKLTIIIDGEKQELPADIGISGTGHEEIHTHDKDVKDDIVHMEMSGIVTKDETKLGNFFRIWGKELSATQILDKKNGVDGNVTMMVNGKENKEFGNYLMKDKDRIEIRYEK